ncbi:M56 family metallopeptidase [Paraflavitalea speifideaquila]|uniref:M56 family metallopeptidase n=1 Tax=Paraflavitalea speifideaquila TaxID=3076558 RepID=UPI0028EED058|nr:M56 family metallopeptidase [Paraflavitalea speifideiaquila]
MIGLFVNGSILEQGLQAFCWMLVHSLWQGLLLALLGGIVMLLTRKARPATRYALLTGLLFLFLVSCLVTFIVEWNRDDTTGASLSMTGALGSIGMLQEYGIHQIPAALAQFCSDNANLIVGLWFVVFVLKCCQMGWAFGYVQRVRTKQLQEPGHFWKDKMTVLTAQLQIRRTVGLLESGITKIPVVIGHLKPVIYMPVGLLANLPPDQVEPVLLHELAHIRRHDYLVNLLQHTASIVFFFNPGLLWVSSLIKQEREHCCDDMALAHTGNKKQFIQALISFKEQVVYGRTYAMAFPGKKSHLLQRVTRIIQNRNSSLSGGEKYLCWPA